MSTATTIGVSRLIASGTSKGARTPDIQTPGDKLADELVKRQKRLEQRRQDQDSLWDDVDDNVSSRRAHYDIGYKKGVSGRDEGGTNIYDNISGDSAQKFADHFQAQTASPIIKWWAGRFRGPLRKDTRAMKWMDEVEETMAYELARSPFYEEYNEIVQDDVTHGIGTLAGPEWNQKKGRLDFRSFHPRQIFCSFDIVGNPVLWHDKFPITGRQIIKEFPEAKIPDELKKRIDDNPFREFMCIHAIYERTERDIKSPAATDMKWASVWVLEVEKLVLFESGYNDLDNPMDTWIWRKGSGGLYCFSPAIDAIYDVIMENHAAKALLKAVQLSVEPPLIITEGVKGNVNFFPLGQTVLHGPNDKVSAFQFPTNFAISVEQINDMRKQLAQKFRADIFTTLSDMPHQMTAFQASGIQGEKASGLIPIVTRSSSQMLIPKLDKTFRELARNNRLPTPPSSLMRYMNSPVDIELMGPVSTAAKRFLNQQGFNAMMAQLAEIAQILPPQLMQAVAEGFDADAIRKFLIESNSAPQKLQLDDDVIAAIRQARMKAMQEQKQLESMKGLAEAANKGGTAPDQGSLTDSIMRGSGGNR